MRLTGICATDYVLFVTAFQIVSMLNVHIVTLLLDCSTIAVKTDYLPDEKRVDTGIAAAK